MADAAVVTSVKAQLPDEAVALGFTDDIVAALLDGGSSENKTILVGWKAIAAKSATMGDISESSSSRSMPLFDRAASMIPIFQALVDKEELLAGTNARQHAVSHTAVRV